MRKVRYDHKVTVHVQAAMHVCTHLRAYIPRTYSPCNACAHKDMDSLLYPSITRTG